MRRTRLVGAWAALLCMACGGGSVGEWCEAVAGSDVVVNEGAPVELRLAELWRAGGTREGEHLAYPVGVYASRAGLVAIPDFVLAQVTVVAEDGRWLGAWAEKGEGPGELSTPVAAAWRSDSVLAVLDLPSSRVLFLRDGAPVDELGVDREATGPIVSSGQLPWAGLQPDGGVLLVPTGRPLDDEGASGRRTQPLLRIAPGASSVDTLVLDTVRTLGGERYTGWALPGEPVLSAAVGPAGMLAVAGTDGRYRILVMDDNGRPARVICRDAPPLAVSSRERGLIPDLEGPPALIAIIRNAPVADDPAATGHLFFGAAGRLWVQRNRRAPIAGTPLPGVAGAIHDVFDRDGALVGTVTAPAGVHLLAAHGDTVWGLERGELDEVWVVAMEVGGSP